MTLKFVVPMFDFDYLVLNKSSKDMWNNKIDFHGNLKDYVVDDNNKIVIRKFNFHNDCRDLSFDAFSQLDIEYLAQAMWAIEFECERGKVEDYK